jgi:hypothetical protein
MLHLLLLFLQPERGKGLDADNNSSTGDSNDENSLRRSRRNRKWLQLDSERLRTYVKEEIEWKWIFKQFPGRTEAAVRTQVSLVKK